MPQRDQAPRHLFSCDPGKLSGVAELSFDPFGAGLSLQGSMEVQPDDVGRQLEAFLGRYGPHEAVVVAERFTITMQTAKNSQAPWSLEVIGMMKWLVSRWWGLPYDSCIALQKPSDAKAMVPNELLRSIGLWHRGGAGHANDAIRHGVYAYARVGVTDPWQ